MATPIEILRDQAKRLRSRAEATRQSAENYQKYASDERLDAEAADQQAADCEAAADQLEKQNG